MNDLIIIGAGPGGYELAIEASKQGLKVVLIEKNALGGTCLNCGCIPTKTYYSSAKVLHNLKKYPEIETQGTLDFKKLKERKDKIISDLQKGIDFLLHKEKVEIIYGVAKIISSHEVYINEQIIKAQNIVIATGSIPKTLFPIDQENVLDSESLLNQATIPPSLIIIGGGVIGIEMATIFNELGSKVTIIEASSTILPSFDQEVSKRLLGYLKSNGIKIILKAKIEKIEKNKILYYLDQNVQEIIYDKTLLAIGRKAFFDNLFDAHLGLKTSAKGIVVDENFQTNIASIYAIGDVTGQTQLAHYATYSGYRVLNHILGKKDQFKFELTPSCVFTFPELAMLGLTEEKCLAQNLEYQVVKSFYRTNGKANAMQATEGFVKIIIHQDKIIGAHILGEEANILIHELLIIMNQNLTYNELKNYIHAHPTLSEVLSNGFKN